MKPGLLLIPSTNNGATLKNVLAIVFNEYFRKNNGFPEVGRITFLENSTLHEIHINGESVPPSLAYDQIIRELEITNIEIRKITIDDYSSQIPELVISAVKEVGVSNIIIDLTNGMRDLTGSLYTAASLCKIDNIFYIEVFKHKDENGREAFYELSPDDDKIETKYRLRRFESLKEMESLASMNCMEFVMYNDSINDIEKKNTSTQVKMICNNFYVAVADYFRGGLNIVQAMRCIGVLNENLIKNVSTYMKTKYCRDDVLEGSKGLRAVLEKYNDKYNNLCDKKRKGINIDDGDELLLTQMSEIFDVLPSLYFMVRTVQSLRNKVAHNQEQVRREDAKLMITVFLTILDGLQQTGKLSEIYAEEEEGSEEEME